MHSPGKASRETRINLLCTDGSRALYQLEPVSSKRYQLRVHMLALGLPLEGDFDPPPLKWSDLKYVLWHQGGSEHAKEEAHA